MISETCRFCGLVDHLSQFARSIRNRFLYRRFFERDRQRYKTIFFPETDDVRVLSGPFVRMRYHNTSLFGPITPKWLGSYESELHDIVEAICTEQYRQVINVGSADGYYSVGFAIRIAGSRIYAFDIDPFARHYLRLLAKRNGLSDRLEIERFCNPRILNGLGGADTLLVMDIEGEEVNFLDPEKCPALREMDILVEIHESDPDDEQVEAQLKARFNRSHAIVRRVQTDRNDWCDRHESMWKGKLNREEIRRAANEFRTMTQVWLWMRSLQSKKEA